MNTGAALRGGLLLAATAALPAQGAAPADPARRAQHLVRRLELRGEARAAVRELMTLGSAAVAPLHVALRDPRSEVVQWALFACSGLPGDIESLREPIRVAMASKDLGIALAAARAWPALDARGQTLVADYMNKKVLAIDARGTAKELGSLPMAMSAARLSDGHLLVSVYGNNRVVEFDPSGAEVWSCDSANSPSDAERLPNGNTLIADSSNHRVIEVSPAGEVVWSYDKDVTPIDVDRLGNGNTLIGSYQKSGVVEVDPDGVVVWQMPGENVRDADRLPDGTTLVLHTDKRRAVLVGADLAVMHEWRLDFDANDAELLPDGHLLVAGEGRVVELDEKGAQVWRHAVAYAGHVARYGHRAPAAPAGGGPGGSGKR